MLFLNYKMLQQQKPKTQEATLELDINNEIINVEQNELNIALHQCKEFNFPKFEDIKISTKTIIATTNLTIYINKIFDFLPITNYTIVPKKRGRRRKDFVDNPNKNLDDGSIITVKYQDQIRGVDLKKKKKKSKYFRNALTVVMIIDGKLLNFKISQNGKFQITGCKNNTHAEKCIKYIWSYIKNKSKDYYNINGKIWKLYFKQL